MCDFHEFYKMVEDSHRHMTERFIVKSESVRAKRRPSLDVNNLINYSSLPSKREPDDEFDELGEVPFNMLMDDTTDEPGKTVAKAAAIALGAEDSHDLLSNHNFSQDECDNASRNGNEKLDRPSQTPDCENDMSFDGEAFMNNILTNKNEQTQSRSSTKTDRRRSTRSSKKLQLNLNSSLTSEDNSAIEIKKRRGRPRKEDKAKPSENQNVNSDKLNKSDDEQDAYKTKMKEIDDQIAQYLTLHCEICNCESENFAGLRAHMREAHNIGKGYAKCCNKKFLKRALLLDHIRQHLDPYCYRYYM